MILKNKKGFTLIELLVVILIIGILASVLLVMWRNGVIKRAAVSSYKTTMKSVQTAVELCAGTGDTPSSGAQGDKICSIGDERYPDMSNLKCGGTDVGGFVITYDNPTTWRVTTTTAEGCRGCRLSCTSEKCDIIEDPLGSCNPT